MMRLLKKLAVRSREGKSHTNTRKPYLGTVGFQRGLKLHVSMLFLRTPQKATMSSLRMFSS